ncbi:hypothetical protein AcV7_007101 [Taiwanofungus camphoratus]|nr:hypothetical protein AcV7_007101 [Antrodia cinnamomea]
MHPARQRYHDPRMGDEGPADEHRPHAQQEHPHAEKHVRLEAPSDGVGPNSAPASGEKKAPEQQQPRPSRLRKLGSLLVHKFPINLQWVPNNWTWSKIKPVIRSAAMGWVSVLFMIIPRTERMLGQASFLILIAALLDPPSDPFIGVLERELVFLTFVTIAWAWSCLGIFLGNLARKRYDYTATFATVLTGQYIEAAPTIIMAIFIFIGIATYLYIKARQGPGPFLFATVFSCICIDISMTTAILFPYPYYQIGRAIVLPIAFHSALCILASVSIFPSTISAQYTQALVRVLDPLHSVLAEHRAILKIPSSSASFPSAVSKISGLVSKSEGALAPAGAALRLVKHDIVWGRFAPTDIGALQFYARRLVTRANGMGIFFTLIEPTRERFPVTPLPSRPGTPFGSRPVTPVASRAGTPWGTTPVPSRPPSPDGERARDNAPTPPRGTGNGVPRTLTMESTQTQTQRRRRNVNLQDRRRPSSLRLSLSRHLHIGLRRHEEDTQHERLHFSLLNLAHTLSLPRVATVSSQETAVGVFESQRYLTLEATRLSRPDSPDATEKFTALLGESCDELLGACAATLKGVQSWIANVRKGSFNTKTKVERERAERLASLGNMRESMNAVLERFRSEKRHRVLDPYRSAFDPKHVGTPEGVIEPPPHRYLFHCYVYEYHLMQFAILLVDILDEVIRLEKNYKKARLWTPSLPISRLLDWTHYSSSDDVDQDDDEDPDMIPGIDQEMEDDLGMASRRDPDALPAQNTFQKAMNLLHRALVGLSGGNALFALKAGVLTIILCLPSFLKSSAQFAYGERFVWGIFMGQLTLARFRGDTTFALVARLVSTFLGGLVGMVIWYISAGNGTGNPYGLAAACGVVFPFFYFGRLYWPGPPMTNVIFFVTAALVIGYSWQNTHYPVAFKYYGFDLAWRRFVLVAAGVTAAFVFSLLPPSTTLRRYQRTMLSTTVAELGSVYCSIVSFANTRGRQEVKRGEIIQSLVAIRMKLKRSVVLKTNIVYEFSLRGKWPAERYQKILELQIQIAYLLSHLMSVVEHLEPAWSRAFLRRTRFLDSDFQGDVLAVISTCTDTHFSGFDLGFSASRHDFHSAADGQSPPSDHTMSITRPLHGLHARAERHPARG